LRMQDMLANSTRPISAGMVTEDAMIPDVPGLIGGGTPYQQQRKADATRAVKYKTADGRMIEGELLSPKEQADRAREFAVQRAREEAQARADVNQGTFDRTSIPLPTDLATMLGAEPGTRIKPEQLDELARAAASVNEFKLRVEQAGKPKEKTVRSSNLSKDDSGRQVQVVTYSDGTIEERPLKSRGTTKQAGGGRDGGPTAGQSLIQERFDTKMQLDSQKELDRLQEKENELHAQRLQIGEMANAGGYDKMGEKEARAKMASTEFQIRAIQASKKRVMDSMQKQEGSPLKAKAAAAGKPAGAKAATHRFNPATGQIEVIK
jgi:hypothetical protein